MNLVRGQKVKVTTKGYFTEITTYEGEHKGRYLFGFGWISGWELISIIPIYEEKSSLELYLEGLEK